MNTNFQGKKVPKENASYKRLSLIMLDSVIRVNKKYYPSDDNDNESDNEICNQSDNESDN